MILNGKNSLENNAKTVSLVTIFTFQRKCQNIYKKWLITLRPKIKQHALNASWQKRVLQISQARFIHVPLSQRSTWASICWSKPGQSSVFSSATSNQWKFKGLLKDWTKHMWLRRSACQRRGVIQHRQPESICSLRDGADTAASKGRSILWEMWSQLRPEPGKRDPLCPRYLLGRTCATAVVSAPDGRVSPGRVRCKPFTLILPRTAGLYISCSNACFSQEKGLSKRCCSY